MPPDAVFPSRSGRAPLFPLDLDHEPADFGRRNLDGLPDRTAPGALEVVPVRASIVFAAAGEIHLVDDLPAERGDPEPRSRTSAHYAALPERRPIHSEASSRVSSEIFFPTISSNFGNPFSTVSPMSDSR